MKKKVITGLIISFLIVTSYIFIQFNRANNIENTCFNSNFDKVFKKENGYEVNKENSFKLNEIYDFSEIFNCEDWDKIIIVGGPNVNRASIFVKEGIALPKIDYSTRLLDGTLVLFFIKDGKLISSPITLWQSGFLYYNEYKSVDYIKLNKKDAVFKCVVLETIGFEEPLLTFELIDKGSVPN